MFQTAIRRITGFFRKLGNKSNPPPDHSDRDMEMYIRHKNGESFSKIAARFKISSTKVALICLKIAREKGAVEGKDRSTFRK